MEWNGFHVPFSRTLSGVTVLIKLCQEIESFSSNRQTLLVTSIRVIESENWRDPL